MNNKKQGQIFFLAAYLVPFLCGGLIYYGKSRGLDISFFPLLQMLTPALGAILIIILGGDSKSPFPRKAFSTYLAFTGVIFLASLASIFIKNFPSSQVQTFLLPGFSLFFLFSIFKTDKNLGKIYQLSWTQGKKVLLTLLIFFLLYFLRAFVTTGLEEGPSKFLTYLTPNKIIYILLLLVNFPFSFVFFFGEEYGWRFYLQPLLQKNFGMVKGTLLVGILWGIWHLPLNLFFYSAGNTGLISLVNQLFVCVSYGIFFSFAYNYSKSLWAPILIHYFNNNLILVFTENMDPSIIENQVFTWSSTLLNGLLMLVIFGSFIFSSYNRNPDHRRPSLDEIQNLEVTHEKIKK